MHGGGVVCGPLLHAFGPQCFAPREFCNGVVEWRWRVYCHCDVTHWSLVSGMDDQLR